MNTRTIKSALLGLATTIALSSAAWADITPPGPPCIPGQPGRGGTVTEHSREPNTTFIIHLTDFDYNDIPGKDIHPPSIPDGHGGTTINPVVVPAMKGLCDARNETIKPPRMGGRVGPRADLSIESVFVDATGKFRLANIWGTIAQQLGPDAVVAIPDLYMANANGDPLDDTILYSLVDLAIYLKNVPVFAEGEVFSVVNGQVAGLPGMFFSTTPFTFDPDRGFSDPPYTGTAVAETQHGFSVPEPAPLVLLAAALCALGVARRRTHFG